MREGSPNPDGMQEYLEWRRERFGPKEGPELRTGDIVRAPRSSGDIDEGWVINFLYPDNNGRLMAKITKEGVGEKNLPLSILEEVN